MARPPGAQNKDKPFREALRMELASAGDDLKRLRAIARKLLDKAEEGDLQAVQQVADRLDGKPPQFVTDDADKFAEALNNMSDDDLAKTIRAEVAELGLSRGRTNGKGVH